MLQGGRASRSSSEGSPTSRRRGLRRRLSSAWPTASSASRTSPPSSRALQQPLVGVLARPAPRAGRRRRPPAPGPCRRPARRWPRRPAGCTPAAPGRRSTTTPTPAPISVSRTLVQATPTVPPRVMTSRALIGTSIRCGPSLRTGRGRGYEDDQAHAPPVEPEHVGHEQGQEHARRSRWRPAGSCRRSSLTRVSWVTSRAVRPAPAAATRARAGPALEITAARVVLAVRRPSGEPSSRRRPAAAGRPAWPAGEPTGAASAARSRPVRRPSDLPRKAGWMTAASARSNASR